MRYICKIAFDGSKYKGWQHQINAKTVQDTLAESLVVFLRSPTEITGCGRTDTGVHASKYYFHFDTDQFIGKDELMHINAILPSDIVIQNIIKSKPDAHVRFDAYERTYEYFLQSYKNPFNRPYSFTYYQFKDLDMDLLQKAASLLLNYDDFTPFCKTNSGAKSKLCKVTSSFWEVDEGNQNAKFTITANRFLRGMVRLVVGMCLNVASGKMTINEVNKALEEKGQLPKPWSVPPCGLFLSDIKYPYQVE